MVLKFAVKTSVEICNWQNKGCDVREGGTQGGGGPLMKVQAAACMNQGT